MQAWTGRLQQRAARVTFNYDPVGSGGGREQFLAGGATSPARTARSATTSSPRRTTAARRRPVRAAELRLGHRGRVQPRGVDDLDLSPGHARGSSPARSPPGTTRRSPRTTRTPAARAPRSPRFTAATSRARPRTSPTTCKAAGTSGPPARSRSGRPQGGEAAAAPPAGDAVKRREGTIGYADECQAGHLASAKIKVGDQFVAPSAEAAATVVASSARSRAAASTTSPST